MSNENVATVQKKRRHRVSLDARKARSGYLFVLPFILGILLIYLPILLDSLWLTVANRVYVPSTETYVYDYIGFENYVYAFTGSPDFVQTLLDSIQGLVLQVPAILIFSLFVAVVLNQKMLGRALFRAIFFVPVIISTGLMESIGGTVNSGTIDDGSGSSGASQFISALDVKELFKDMKVGGELVTYVVDLVNSVYNIINYSGVQMLIFLAGLQSISPSIYEACQIEGATGWETFWKITFPMISPMILVNAIYTMIDCFTRQSSTMMTYITKMGESWPGRATTMAWIYFLAIILLIAAVAGIISSFIFYQRRD